MQIKSSADNSVLNYCYRADGGKFSALDADKTGLIYIGSLVYKQTAGSKIEFESAAFSDGRFRRNTHSWNTNYAPEYYLKDHLGSPRAFVDWSGELIALRDYYAFGKSWQKPNSPATWDLSRFNGKEEQPVGGAGLLDYGARFYHPDLGRWLTQDPMAEKFNSVSPYNFCLNNPIRYTDPFGLEPQQGRQIGVRDYYFSEYGMYLGRDDAMTNNVRIIAFSRWSSLKKILGRVNHDEAKKKSVLFSYATFNGVPGAYNNPMPDFAILGIYDWVNNRFNITQQLLFIRNKPGSNTLMTSLSRIIRNESGVPIDLAEAPIAINHIAWAELGYCDNIYNIASALDHEYMHELTWRTDLVAADQMGTPGRERIAYHYQIYQSIYWQYTTSSFKRSVQKAYNRYF